MHGNLSETALFNACDSREPPFTRSLLPNKSHNCSRSDPKGAGDRPTGVTPPDLFLQPPARGSSSAANLGTQPFDYSYLRTTIEAMARLYRVIVLSEDPRSTIGIV